MCRAGTIPDAARVVIGEWAPGLLGSWAPGLLGSWAPGLLGSLVLLLSPDLYSPHAQLCERGVWIWRDPPARVMFPESILPQHVSEESIRRDGTSVPE